MGSSGLGSLLVKEGFLTEQDRTTINKTCGQGSWAFAKSILSMGLLDEDELAAFFAERTRYVVASKNFLQQLDPGIGQFVDKRMFARLEILPLEIDAQKITVAVADPLDKSTLKQLEFFTGLEILPIIAPLSQIYEGLTRLIPEFQPRYTALSSFLRNHAGSSWVKQRITEQPELLDVLPARSGARSDEDFSDDADIEEMDGGDDEALAVLDAPDLNEDIGSSDFDDLDMDEKPGAGMAAGSDDDDDAQEGVDLLNGNLDSDDAFDAFGDDDDLGPGASEEASGSAIEAPASADDGLWPDEDDASSLGPDDDGPPSPSKKPAAASSGLSALDDTSDLEGLGALDDDTDFSADAPGADDDDSSFAETAKALSDSDALASSLDDDEHELDDRARGKDAPELVHADPAFDLEGDEGELGLDQGEPPGLAFEDEISLDAEASEKTRESLAMEDSGFSLHETLDADEDPRAVSSDDKDLDVALDLVSEDGVEGDELESFSLDAAAAKDEADDDMELEADPAPLAADGLEDFDDIDQSADAAKKDSLADQEHASKDDDLGHFESDDDQETETLPSYQAEAQPLDLLRASLRQASEAERKESTPPEQSAPPRSVPPSRKESTKLRDFDVKALNSEPDPSGLGQISIDNGPGASSLTPQDRGQRAPETSAAANELMLRSSLCFDAASLWQLFITYAPQLADEGCLLSYGNAAKSLLGWRNRKLHDAALPDPWISFVKKLLPQLEKGAWMRLQIPAGTNWIGEAQELALYRSRSEQPSVLWLGSHGLDDAALLESLSRVVERWEKLQKESQRGKG